MVSPGLEKGYTPVPNELLDNLAHMHLSPNKWQVVVFIIRKTYGFHKDMDKISNSQIVEGTGIGKTHISRTVKSLVTHRVLIRIGKAIGIQKDHELWLVKLPELVTIDTEVTNTGNTGTENSYQNEPEKLPIMESELPERAKKVTSSNDTQKKERNIQKKLYKRKSDAYSHTKGPVDPDKYIRGPLGHMVNR